MQIIKQSTATLYAIQYKCALTELAIETDATNPQAKGWFLLTTQNVAKS